MEEIYCANLSPPSHLSQTIRKSNNLPLHIHQMLHGQKRVTEEYTGAGIAHELVDANLTFDSSPRLGIEISTGVYKIPFGL